MELLDAFKTYRPPNEIGPGVYDIHSPRVPDVAEMTVLLGLARQRLADSQLWVNPDCGLKTRKWDEVKPAIATWSRPLGRYAPSSPEITSCVEPPRDRRLYVSRFQRIFFRPEEKVVANHPSMKTSFGVGSGEIFAAALSGFGKTRLHLKC